MERDHAVSDTGKTELSSLKIQTPWLADAAAFIGEVARPFAIISTSYGAAHATLILAMKVNSPEAAVFLGAVFVGVGALYGAKAWEKVTQIRQDGKQ